ncbi:MAG: cupin domain-containing protein [Nitrospinae bacterium]|nr:cupin domain-containing protein [Nitrospinota bacterium]
MKRMAVTLALVLAVGVAVGAIGTQVLNAQEPIKRTVLFKTDLPGSPEKEALVINVELAPGAAAGKHYHPGHEFVYVVEGSATLMVKGKRPVALKPGATAHLLPKQVHDVKNASTTPLKALVLAIYEKGQPPVVAVKEREPTARKRP